MGSFGSVFSVLVQTSRELIILAIVFEFFFPEGGGRVGGGGGWLEFPEKSPGYRFPENSPYLLLFSLSFRVVLTILCCFAYCCLWLFDCFCVCNSD